MAILDIINNIPPAIIPKSERMDASENDAKIPTADTVLIKNFIFNSSPFILAPAHIHGMQARANFPQIGGN